MQKHSLNQSNTLNVTIVGAGFSGLCLAYFFHKNGYNITVVEKSKHVGGLLQSPITKHGVVDHGANGLINSKNLIELCSDIGLDILYPSESAKKKFLFSNGKKLRWPFSFFETIKLIVKVIQFKFNKEKYRPLSGELFSSWAERVFFKKALTKLIEPAFQGVYAAYSNQLSAKLVTKNLFKKSSKKTSSTVKRQTVSFNGGMNEFCCKLYDYLSNNGVFFKFSSELKKINPGELHILTCDAHASAQLLLEQSPDLANDLSSINKVSIAKVACFSKKELINPEGFGCLFPKNEKFNALGVLFDSSIFPTRYEGYSLHTWIFGDQFIDKYNSDSNLLDKAKEDITKLFDCEAEVELADIKTWKKTLPLYDETLEAVLSKYNFDEQVLPNIYLMGNYTGDIGLSQLLEKAKKLTEQINYEQTK